MNPTEETPGKGFKKLRPLLTLLLIAAVLILFELQRNPRSRLFNIISYRAKPNVTTAGGCTETDLPDTLPYDPRKLNFFLVETKGNTRLGGREACSIESAALHHPIATVNALMVAQPDFNSSYMKVLRNISNVRIVHIDPSDIMNNTCLKSWYWSPQRLSSPFRIIHTSDALRFALLWHYGGIYIDTDVLVQRSMLGLRNTLGDEWGLYVASAILVFDKGHPFLSDAMARLVSKYQPYEWAGSGPMVLQHVITERCPKCVSGKSFVPCQCDVHVLPEEAFCPIPYVNWKDMLNAKETAAALKKSNQSYVVHFWNHYTEKWRFYTGKGSLYDVMAKRNCPRAYKVAKKIGYF